MEALQNTATTTKKDHPKVQKKNIGVDLTPMVDLGFLLITFFMFSTVLAMPKALKLRMPADTYQDSTLLDKEKSLTIIADNKGYYTYEPKTEAIDLQKIKSVEMLREKIITKKKNIVSSYGIKENLNIVLKLDKNSKYETLIQLLDEMTINDISYYILVKLTEKERNAMKDLKN